jgi:Ca-activated chloride channel family protein
MTVRAGKSPRRERDRRPLLIAAVFVLMLTSGLGGWPRVQQTLCPSILIASSNEKSRLMTQLAADYSSTHGSWWSGCGPVVTVENVASGDAEHQLEQGWPGPGRPDVWTPAATTWVLLLQNHRQDLVPVGEPLESIANSPLVVAMPDPMARAMGWPTYQPTWSDFLELARDPRGWGRFGRPDWGPFRLGMTDPRTSTSGIHSLIATYETATGTPDPTRTDVEAPATKAFVGRVETTISHYASTAGIFLDNMAAADSLNYVSAVAVEEQEVFNYNEGLHSSETPKEPPRISLDAFYPAGLTLVADHPFVVLETPWLNQAKLNIATGFLAWLREPAQQLRFTDDGFRDYLRAAKARLADEPGILMSKTPSLLPSADSIAAIGASWGELRKPARIAIVLDLADKAERSAVEDSVSGLLDTDQVEIWTVTSSQSLRIRSATSLAGDGRKRIIEAIDAAPLRAGPGPLYWTIKGAYESFNENADAAHISAVVIVSSHHDDGLTEGRTGLEREIRGRADGTAVRVYTVAGPGSDREALLAIAKASGGVPSISSDPASAIRTSLGNY